MSDEKSELELQLAGARRGMDRYRDALAALANPEVMSDDMKQRVEIARERMRKYRAAYRGLADS